MKKILVLIAAFILIGLGIWFATGQTESSFKSDDKVNNSNEAQQTANSDLPIIAKYKDSEGREVEVVYDNHAEAAVLTGIGFNALLLPQAVSASGARYENTENGVVLWNKGDELTITEYDTNLFIGSIEK